MTQTEVLEHARRTPLLPAAVCTWLRTPCCGVHLAENPPLRCALGSEPPAVDVHAQQAIHDLDAAVGSPVHTDAKSNEAAATEHAGADVILPLLTVPSLVCALLLRTNAHC
jgi:hypothetical protein